MRLSLLLQAISEEEGKRFQGRYATVMRLLHKDQAQPSVQLFCPVCLRYKFKGPGQENKCAQHVRDCASASSSHAAVAEVARLAIMEALHAPTRTIGSQAAPAAAKR